MERNWTASNTAEARSFWQSETGRMFLDRLNQGIPEVTGTTMEQAAMEGSRVAGYRQCLKQIEAIYRPLEKALEAAPFVNAQEE